MRCPKCGKMLDDMAPQCHICKTKFRENNDVSAKLINNADSSLRSDTANNYINQQPKIQTQPQQFQQPPQPQFQPSQQPQFQSQSYPQQNNTRFCGICGAPMDANVPFCSRCGATVNQSIKKSTNAGARLLNLPYAIYALLATNLFLAFTTLLNFVVYSPSAEDYWKDGMRADVKYNFWDVSSNAWDLYEYYNKSRYLSEPTSIYWEIIVVILMYVVAFLFVVFIVRAFIKAYSNIGSKSPDSLPVLTNLRTSSIIAVVQAMLLIILRFMLSNDLDRGKHEGAVSFSFWFYIIIIFAIGSLFAEIFLIKAHSSSNKGYM